MHVSFFSRLSVQSTAMIVLLALAFLLIVYYFFLSYTNDLLRRSVGEESLLVVQQTLERINDAVVHRAEFFQTYAHDPQLAAFLAQENQTFENLPDRASYIAEADAAWIATPQASTTDLMRQVTDNTVSDRLRSVSAFFAQKYETSVFPEIFLTNAYGVNVAQTGRTTDYYQADEEWWQQAALHGIYVDRIDRDESAGVQAMDIAVAVRADNGTLLGVFKIVLSLEEVVAIIDRIVPTPSPSAEQPAHGQDTHASLHLTLVGQDSTLIFSNSPYATKERLQHYQHVFESATTSYHYTMNLGEDERLVTLAGLDIAQSLNGADTDLTPMYWTLVFDQDVDDVLTEPAEAMNRFVLIIMLTFTLFVLLFLLFLTTHVTGPLSRLTAAANEMASGQTNVAVKTKGKGEIAHLMHAFNYMVQGMQRANKDLEEKVSQRTRELQESRDVLQRKNAELERVNKTMVGRELKMIELKERIAELEEKNEQDGDT